MTRILSKISGFLILSLFMTSVAYAAPTVSSGENQSFEENQMAVQLRNITITEDSETASITQGELRITIPDSQAIIFDDERSELDFVLFGTAVDNGRMAEQPELTWEDGDKTVVIPVLENFEAGEYVVVSKLFVEGFNESSISSSNLMVSLPGSDDTYTDAYYLNVISDSNTDSQEPESPTALELSVNESGVYLEWEDPTDLDVQIIEILRGKNEFPVSGTPYATVGDGEETYLDTDVEEGDTVTYILRAYDGRHYSDLTAEYSIEVTFVEPEVPEEEVIPEEVPEELPEEEEEVPEEIPEEEEVPEPVVFEDVEGHWGETAIYSLTELGIVEGDPAGTFRPNDSLNRAEAATLIYRVWEHFPHTEEAYELEELFSDVFEEDWYFSPVMNLEARGFLNGNPDGTFEPGENINRAEFLQMAVTFYEALNGVSVDLETTAGVFVDLDESAWYATVVATAGNEGWVDGYECDGGACFYAANEISRAEATQILLNMFFTE